ncbi:MAG: hypothetical protein ABSG81_05235 [Acidimicrobiales bacterium]|jgi:hypothetical protein
MGWKPVAGQVVVAHLCGRLERVRVTDFDPGTGAVRVVWPPHDADGVSARTFAEVRTEIPRDRYVPLDPRGFRAATADVATELPVDAPRA